MNGDIEPMVGRYVHVEIGGELAVIGDSDSDAADSGSADTSDDSAGADDSDTQAHR